MGRHEMLSITIPKYYSMLSITWLKSKKKTAIPLPVTVATSFILKRLVRFNALNAVRGMMYND